MAAWCDAANLPGCVAGLRGVFFARVARFMPGGDPAALCIPLPAFGTISVTLLDFQSARAHQRVNVRPLPPLH